MSVGWLAGTRGVWDGQDERGEAWSLFATVQRASPSECSSGHRSQYYRSGFRADDGSYSVVYDGIGQAKGSVMLSVRQSVFERLGPEASWALVLVLLPGLRVSRLDLAADVDRSSAMTPAMLFGLLPAARSRSRPANRILTVDAAGGEKLTIGSRASERYLRVYVKGERVRHELELKQGAAQSAMADLIGGVPLPAVWAGHYGRVVEWPSS